MKLVVDIEANGLNPTHIWCIVCKDIDTGELYVFRNPTEDEEAKQRFLSLVMDASLFVGHNILGYDGPVIRNLLGCLDLCDCGKVVDTLILSKLIDYSRPGHSLEDYGEELGIPKNTFSDFTKYSKELEDRCIVDVNINYKVYLKYLKFINNEKWKPSIALEHQFQLIVNDLHTNGFSFNKNKAEKMLEKITKELVVLDKDILDAFPPREVLIREFTPKATKFGTISRSSVPRALVEKIDTFEVGRVYRHTRFEDFNPSSHKQIIQVLSESGWSPTDKTQTHIDTERELNRLKYGREELSSLDIAEQTAILKGKLESLKRTGWKVNETNLQTLPETAPAPSRLLAKRILLESRRRTLTEWLALVWPEDDRIHGKFYGIGAWTHRMAHQNPNTANIPTGKKLMGDEMRSLWKAPKNRLLVGVDAEGIQLRIFAHYIDDPDFIKALVEGKKDDGTDPHSFNQRILACKSRDIAKRFIFAFLLGAGIGKLAQILEVSENEGRSALDRLLDRYKGLAYLKETIIPADARRGYFAGIDGRLVKVPGATPGERKHLCMSGYLQNGEKVVIAKTIVKTVERLKAECIPAMLVNIVHDEVIFETKNDVMQAEYVNKVFCESITEVGIELGLKCPLAGDGHVGLNWLEIH